MDFRRRDSLKKVHHATSGRKWLVWNGIYLDGIDVVGDADQLGLLFLNEGGHRVDAVADDGRALGGGVTLAVRASLSALTEALLLLLLRLRPVLVEELEQLSG